MREVSGLLLLSGELGGGLALGSEVHLLGDLESCLPVALHLLLHLEHPLDHVLLLSVKPEDLVLHGLLPALVGLDGGQQLLSLFESVLEDFVESVDL